MVRFADAALEGARQSSSRVRIQVFQLLITCLGLASRQRGGMPEGSGGLGGSKTPWAIVPADQPQEVLRFLNTNSRKSNPEDKKNDCCVQISKVLFGLQSL